MPSKANARQNCGKSWFRVIVRDDSTPFPAGPGFAFDLSWSKEPVLLLIIG